jgi:hypothetical protein
MSSKTKIESKRSSEEAVKAAVKEIPGGTAEGVAQVAGIGRSTAGKVLARLADAGEVTRHQGGHDRGKRLPDRWTLAGVEMPDAYATYVLPAETPAAPAGEGKGAKASTAPKARGAASTSNTEGGKLKPGGLDPLVLAYLKDNADSGPHGPTVIAKALQRSSGAIGNCLERLRKDKKVKRVVDKPRRYAIA